MRHFVFIDEHALIGSNFYWEKRKSLKISAKELAKAGLKGNRVQVHHTILKSLLAADKALQAEGFRLFVKDGYRSRSLYQLAFKKRSKKYGATSTHRLMNMEKMPHATGKAVDVSLWNPEKNTEVAMRDRRQGLAAMLLDFYKNKADSRGKRYYYLQKLMITTMQANGFRLGPRGEFFHFVYVPDAPKNYR